MTAPSPPLPWAVRRRRLALGWCITFGMAVYMFAAPATVLERAVVTAALVCVSLVCYVAPRDLPTERERPAADDLERPVLRLDPHNELTTRDLMANAIVFGRTGSGKTTGSGRALARGILAQPQSGGCVLANKPEDRNDWERLMRDTHRMADFLCFSPRDPLRFNVLDHVYRVSSGSTQEVVSCLMTVGETLRNGGPRGRGGEDGDFWRQQNERLLYHAVQIVKLARKSVSAPDLQKFLAGAAQSPDELRSEEWRKGFHSELLQAALAAPKSTADTMDCEESVAFFLGTWPVMADRTRSSILVGVTGILFTFCTGLARELISSDTNFDISDVARGKWLFADTSPSVLGDAGLLLGASLKYVVQKDILRREVKPGDGYTVVWCDEYAQWATSFDARQFLPMCRSHRGCLVALTQSVHGLRATLGGTSEHEANALLANFHHRFIHALGSAEDAEFASKLVGHRHRMLFGGSMAPATSVGEHLFGSQARMTSTFSTQFEPVVPPRAFLNDLRCGGPANRGLTDVIVVRTGECFANGENWLRCTFSQS